LGSNRRHLDDDKKNKEKDSEFSKKPRLVFNSVQTREEVTRERKHLTKRIESVYEFVMTTRLSERHCRSCRGDIPRLEDPQQIAALLQQVCLSLSLTERQNILIVTNFHSRSLKNGK
jgi:hypothetical protein